MNNFSNSTNNLEQYTFDNKVNEEIDVVLDREVLGQLGYYLYVRKIDFTIIKITKNGEIINSLSIPSTYYYKGVKYKITKIDNELFKNCEAIEEIRIPKSVTKIGSRAFEFCKNLHKVIIPKSVIEIEDYAFLGCESLSEVQLKENVKLGKDVFEERCKIINHSFSKQKSSKELEKEMEKEMEEEAILDQPISVKIVITILYLLCFVPFFSIIFSTKQQLQWWQYLSMGCIGLFYIAVAGTFSFFSLKDLWKNKNELNKELLKELGFTDNITSIEIPKYYNGQNHIYKITSIGKNAFSDFTSLDNIIIPNVIIKIGDNAFSNCTSLTELIIPHGVIEIGNNICAGCSKLKKIIIPDSVMRIKNYSVVRNKNFSFYKLENLKYLSIPKHLKDSFDNTILNKIDKVVYREFGEVYLEDYKKKESTNTIPKTTKIEPSISKKMLTISGDLIITRKVQLNKKAYAKGIVNLKKENVENIKKEIQKKYLSNSEYIDFPINNKIINTLFTSIFICLPFIVLREICLNKIDFHNFNFILYCIALLSVIIGCSFYYFYEFINKNELNDDTLKLLGYKNKFNIDSIKIPVIYYPKTKFNYKNKKYIITSIKDGLFKNCKNLKKVKIPDSISKIGAEAFSGCTEINNIKVPDSITEVGNNAFKNVQNVIYNGTDPNAPWGAKALNGMIL